MSSVNLQEHLFFRLKIDGLEDFGTDRLEALKYEREEANLSYALEEAKQAAHILQQNPYITQVGLTGSVAKGVVYPGDIDFMLFVPQDHVELHIDRQLKLYETYNEQIENGLDYILESIDKARQNTTLQGLSARPMDIAILPDSLISPSATPQQAIRNLNTVLNYYDGFILRSALYHMKIFIPEQNDFIDTNVIHPDVFAYMDKLAKLHNDFFEDVSPYYE